MNDIDLTVADIRGLSPWEFRENQLEMIMAVIEKINSGYKHIMMQGSVGMGKSLILYVLSKIFDDSYIYTPQKVLQDQYKKDFPDIAIMKGRDNYPCLNSDFCRTNNKNNCEIYNMGTCKYRNAKEKAIKSPITLMNYSYALSEYSYNKSNQSLGEHPRTLGCFDEAHQIQQQVMGFYERTINLQNIRSQTDYRFQSTPSEFLPDWIEILPDIATAYNKKSHEYKADPKLSEKYSRRAESLLDLQTHLIEEPDNWVCERNNKTYSFKPVDVSLYVNDSLLFNTEINIYATATIIIPQQFCKNINIPLNTPCLNQQSTFPLENSPILKKYVANMGYQTREQEKHKLLPEIKRILKHHKNQKGIIHTNSFDIAQYIYKSINNDRLITHDSTNRQEKINQYLKSTKPLVLISPSLTEGIDLKDDLGRFQIAVKTPNPYPTKQLKQLKNKIGDYEYWNWYNTETFKEILQMTGRIMRHKNDYGTTYLLDKGFERLLQQYRYTAQGVDYFFKQIDQTENILQPIVKKPRNLTPQQQKTFQEVSNGEKITNQEALQYLIETKRIKNTNYTTQMGRNQ